MANARTVQEVPISGKTRTKTSIFWSTVPEKEQFRNVQVPGVALDRFKDAKKNTQSQKYAQVVQKSKSDSAISNTRSDPVNKQGKTGHKFAVKQNDLSGKKNDASSIFKGASSDQLANISTLSESTKARRASLKNLNVEDKKRVANLIKELAKTGEEREFALERLQEERVSFDEQLDAVQGEQKALKLEREALKQRLEKSEKLLKKYESELKDVKTEKEEQEKILKKKFHVQPQSTQTSPLIQHFNTDGTTKSGRFISEQDDIQPRATKKTRSTQAYIGDGESNDRDGRRRWGTPQVLPVYSNSLFDVKVSNVEHSETGSVSEECQRSSVVESSGLHELYLREYSLQLRLQEQQIEIQRQQVQLQQQLQILQQQQQQHQPQLAKQDQRHQEQQHNEHQHQELTQRREKHNEQHSHQQNQEQHIHHQHQPLEYKHKHSNADHKHKKQEWQQQTNQQARHSRELQSLNQPQNCHQQDPQYPSEKKNEEIFTQSSPTQQTNLLQKRTPEREGQQVEAKHRADTTIPHEHADHSPRLRHEHHHSAAENSRQRHEDVFDGQNGEPQTKDRSYTSSGSPSHRYYHHSGHDVEKTRFTVEHQTNRNKGQHGTDSTSFEQRHMRKSPRKHDEANYAKQIDLNNNEYFQPKNRYDINDNLVHDRYPQEYLSESYSETDDDVEHHYSSERPCHCGYYHNHTSRQPVTLDYGQPVSNHTHSKRIPKHVLKQKSPYGIIENAYQKVEPLHAQIYQQPNRQQHSPDRTNSYHQSLLHDSMHTRVPEDRPPSGHHHHLHKGEYHHHPDIREEHHDALHHVTHKHEGESEYAVNKNQPTEHRTYTRHQLRSPTGVLLSPQVGKTEHDYMSSDGVQHSRSQMNRDRSKYLLDDYICNHRTAGQDNTKSNAGYEPRDTSNRHSTKRKISRKSHDGNMEIERVENGHPAMLYMTSQQIQYEDENPNPSYSLYKPNIAHPTREQSEYPRTPPGHNHDSRKRYPNSLVEIVEDLEINSEYEERYSEETEMYSTEEPGYDSDEEESTVLDNIFFLKR